MEAPCDTAMFLSCGVPASCMRGTALYQGLSSRRGMLQDPRNPHPAERGLFRGNTKDTHF